ncbi:hypothetical protein DE146DRAFT_648458 [Phaeosphaeria sp. MPI-PUGE-AT-0046c]|nr:hypothetical protein DE146DRAFT_648458 [Phaeosphaeria sp. MPI-PUGE-AT-0046c]
MSRYNLCQDLLHFQWPQEPNPEHPVDRIHHLLQQYGYSHRFLVIAHRWSRMKTIDWIKEMSVLLASTNEPDRKMTIWPEMGAILTKFEDLTRGDKHLVATDRKHSAVIARRTLVREIKKVGAATIKTIEKALKGMLPKDFPVLKIREAVKNLIAEDCEERGSLVLGSVPGFTEETKRMMTQSWSWTD